MKKDTTELTKQQKQNYISSYGNICPYCESNNIETTGCADIGDGFGVQDVCCNDCNKGWTDNYKLYDVV